MYNAAARRWLDAYTDPRASLYTFSRCMALADLQCDGDYKFVLVDLGTGSSNIKLKVYRGTSLFDETSLLEIPTGLVVFYNEQSDRKFPAIAVASGSSIFIYRNMKPYFKLSIPEPAVNPLEVDLWIQARNGTVSAKSLQELLQNVKNEIGFGNMSYQSQKLLIINPENEEELENAKNAHCHKPIERRAVITCLTTLRKSVDARNSASCIVCGTENGFVYVIDTEAFTVLNSVDQSSDDDRKSDLTIPVTIKTTGLYDVDYRIVTCNRDGRITLLRRGWTRAKTLICLSVPAVDMCLPEDSGNVVVGTMNAAMECYTKKGKKLWNLKLPTHLTSMIVIPLPRQSLTLIAVALSGGEIHFYNGRQLADRIIAADTIAGMVFGQFGQEDHCLVLVTIGGTLQVKMLKRTAQFNVPESATGETFASANHNVKLPLSKKSNIFLETALRERENYLQIHQTFQRDLRRLRLMAAREFANSLKKANNPIADCGKLPLKLFAQVFGLGPSFRILLTLENMSPSSENTDELIARDLAIVLRYDEKIYAIESDRIAKVPHLVPGLTYKFEIAVRIVVPAAISDEIHAYVVADGDANKPILLSAGIEMPICEAFPIDP